MMIEDKVKKASWNPEFIRDLSERVYRKKLDSECGDGTADMPRDPKKMSIRDRAGAYDKLPRLYLDELGFKPPAE